MKTYVITVSKTFLSTHWKAGLPTRFDSKIKDGRKVHTIRGNYPLWAKRIAEVERGEACLSIRQWEDKPYRSKQIEIARFTKDDGVGIQKLELDREEEMTEIFADDKVMPIHTAVVYEYFAKIDGRHIPLEDVAGNDGLSLEEFKAWFAPAFNEEEAGKTIDFAVIHFTNFRY